MKNLDFQLTQSCTHCNCGGYFRIHTINNKLDWSSRNKQLSKLSMGIYASLHHRKCNSYLGFDYLLLEPPATSKQFETNLQRSIWIYEKDSSPLKNLETSCWKRYHVQTVVAFPSNDAINRTIIIVNFL